MQEENLLPKKPLDSLSRFQRVAVLWNTGAENIFLSLLLVSMYCYKTLPIVKGQVHVEPRPSPSNYNSQHAACPQEHACAWAGKGEPATQTARSDFGGSRRESSATP